VDRVAHDLGEQRGRAADRAAAPATADEVAVPTPISLPGAKTKTQTTV
jgi:hypothetical protein